MNLLLELHILFHLPHTLICYHFLECSFLQNTEDAYFVATMFAFITHETKYYETKLLAWH